MVAVELPLKMLLGEWYGPTTTAHVIAVLTSKHSKQLTTAHNSSQQLTTWPLMELFASIHCILSWILITLPTQL